MKRIVSIILLCLLLCLPVLADEGTVIFDRADLLSESELEELDRQALEFAENNDFQIVIVTENGLGGEYIGSCADDFYDASGYLGDGILFILDMEQREWYVSTVGRGIDAFSDYVIDDMMEGVLYCLSEGDYYYAFLSFISQCGQRLADYESGSYVPSEDDYYEYPYEDDGYADYSRGPHAPGSGWIILSVCIGLVAALVVTGSMKSGMDNVRFRSDAAEYTNRASLALTEKQDAFLYHTIARTAKPKDDDINRRGGGHGTFGGGVHVSGGGVSHGGHGGRF